MDSFIEDIYKKTIANIMPEYQDEWGALRHCQCPACRRQREGTLAGGKDLFS